MEDQAASTISGIAPFKTEPAGLPKLPRWALIALLAAIPLWVGALYATLQIHRSEEIAGWLGHGVCGPWGCAAKPEALLGYHAFWLTLLGPIGLIVGLRIEPSIGRYVWAALLAMGVLLTAGIAGWAIIQCLTTGPEHLREYWLQIGGFQLVTSTDVPCVPIAFAGLTCWLGLAIQKTWLAPPALAGKSTTLQEAASPQNARPGLAEQPPADAAGSLGTP